MTNKDKLPTYYKGEIKGILAHEVIADYNLSYNVGTAVTYLLRAGKKINNPKQQDIKKAIDHLNFELEKMQAKEKAALKKINNTYFNENTSSTSKCCKAK